MKKTLCALAVLFTSLPVLAVDVDVIVTGTVKPAACKMELPKGDVVDYGVIDPSILNGTDYTTLAERKIDISISCDAPVKAGLIALNGRAATMAGVTEGATGAAVMPVTIFGQTNIAGVGLGLDGVDKIGGYGIRLVAGSITADTNPVDVIYKKASATVWIKAVNGSLYETTENRHVSWAATGTLFPVAFQNMAGEIGVQAYINKKSELDLSKPVVLDGLTTLEMVYM